MTDPDHELDALGRRHVRLQEQLDELQPQLAEAIRAVRAKHGANVTLQDLLRRSGYRSLETIRQILDPDRRVRMNEARKKTRN